MGCCCKYLFRMLKIFLLIVFCLYISSNILTTIISQNPFLHTSSPWIQLSVYLPHSFSLAPLCLPVNN